MGLLLASLLAAAVGQPEVRGCTGHLCNGEALAPFFEKLERAGSIHIVQLGDSHTAGDMITQPLREALQRRYGQGGRGALPPGRPYPGYLTWGVTAWQSGGWRVTASFGPAGADTVRPIGLSGYTQTAAGAGAALGLVSDDEANRFDRLTVCALKEPSAGTVILRIGAHAQRWPLESRRRGPACRSLDSDALVSAASLETEGAGPVSITSFGTFRRASGIVLSNLGVPGSQMVHLSRLNDNVVRAEIETYRPDLIILAFGTNDGFSPRLDPDRYETVLRTQVARIRRLSGGVPVLLLGAPDAATRNAALATNGGSARPCGDGAFVPGALGLVRERQRRIARELGAAFWDWQAAMGGDCASLAWASRGLMRGDLVHFTRAGGERIGLALFSDLARAGPAHTSPPGRR